MGGKILCWKYLGCGQRACPAYEQESVVCWLEPKTVCRGGGEGEVDGFERCIQCPVFGLTVADDDIRVKVKDYVLLKEEEVGSDRLNGELLSHFAEMCHVLTKLCKGDFSVRLALDPGPEILMVLKKLLNELGKQMQDFVDETHELAMGICEHYETLNRLANNELGARAKEDSSNELIAKLGFLINRCTDSLTSTIARLERAEEATSSAYHQLFDIIEYLPDATFVIDRGGRIIAWNRAMENLTGVGKAAMLGKGDHEYSFPLYGCRRKLLIDYLDNANENLPPNQYTNITRTHNTLSGETTITPISPQNLRNVWVTATALFDGNGNATGRIESIRDLTDLKRSEEEKNRLEAQLFHSRQMESLMLRLGHDLKTPLTPLFTLLPLIRERVDHETRRMVDICAASSSHIMNLCNGAMTLALLSASEQRHLAQQVVVEAAVTTVCREHDENFREKGIRCNVHIPADLYVLAVPDQVTDLLSHLLSNAINASPSGSTITILAGKRGAQAEITVHDQGVGLSPCDRERIFEEFYKVDDARHDVSSSGLGLAICRRIVHNHGGAIWAESEGLGCGTSVVFTLPGGALSVRGEQE